MEHINCSDLIDAIGNLHEKMQEVYDAHFTDLDEARLALGRLRRPTDANGIIVHEWLDERVENAYHAISAIYRSMPKVYRELQAMIRKVESEANSIEGEVDGWDVSKINNLVQQLADIVL
jgi:hypothetical protein